MKDEITSFKTEQNSRKLDELASSKASESKFWRMLKTIDGNQLNNESKISHLNIDGNKIYDPGKIADSFGNNLAKVFTPYNDDFFDNTFKEEIDKFCKSDELFNYESEEIFCSNFSYSELEYALLSLITKSAPGPDKLNNRILKSIGNYGKQFILFLFNKSFNENTIPKEWKLAKMKMLAKKPNDAHNINNYRPISLTNSIIKLLERLVKNRLVYFLESNNLLSKFQSGFRERRSPIDNIFLFMQKCLLGF